jgi:hypothetical protein
VPSGRDLGLESRPAYRAHGNIVERIARMRDTKGVIVRSTLWAGMVRAAGIGVFLAGTLWHPSVRPTQAAGDPNWGGYTGPSPDVPAQANPHEQLVAGLKAEFLREVPPGTLPSADLRARFAQAGIQFLAYVRTPGPMQDVPRTASGVPTPDYAGSGGWYYASVSPGPNAAYCYSNGGSNTCSNSYQEPQKDPVGTHSSGFYANMCGPGSATKLLSHWTSPYDIVNSNPSAHYNVNWTSIPQAEMLSLAVDQGMMQTNDPSIPGVWNTSPRDETKVINNNLTAHNYSFFYLAGSGAGSYDDIWGDHLGYWTTTNVDSDLTFDIPEEGVPSVLDLDARAISAGWATDYAPPHGAVNHLVALNGYNPGTPGTSFPTPSAELFDSASPADGLNLIPSSDNPPGFRSKPISTIAFDPYLGTVGFYDEIW